MSAHRQGLRLVCQRDLTEALERLPLPAFTFDIEQLRFIAVNRRFEDLLGYSRDELQRMTAVAIRPECDVVTFRQTLTRSDSNGFLKARYVRKDGTWMRVKIHYHHLQCFNSENNLVEARLVCVEFWNEAPQQGNGSFTK